MKLCHWRGEIPNFGDELNLWLWPKLLPGFFDDLESELFIGIGSVLFDTYPHDATKIVCGAGYGGYTAPPRIDDSWDIFFVRGPRTAARLGLDPQLGIGDAATLLRRVWNVLPPADARCAVGFMPHFESALWGTWDTIAEDAGIRFIDPRWSVERVLAAIRSCDLLVTEAMHGAIVADALRVPWVPFLPMPGNQKKWFDWTESQKLDLAFQPSTRSTWLELASIALHDHVWLQTRLGRGIPFRRVGSSLFRTRAGAALLAAAASRPYLSSNAVIETTTAKMAAAIERMRLRYDRPPAPSALLV
jgi:succinoglycan biosynthesis protein ExoV